VGCKSCKLDIESGEKNRITYYMPYLTLVMPFFTLMPVTLKPSNSAMKEVEGRERSERGICCWYVGRRHIACVYQRYRYLTFAASYVGAAAGTKETADSNNSNGWISEDGEVKILCEG